MATEQRIEELKVQLANLQAAFEPSEFNPTLKDDLAASFSDIYKSYNGFRPRWVNTEEMDELELLIMMDDLVTAEERQREWEEEQDRLDAEAKERAMTTGIGELPEPDWKQQLRTLA